ncbi:MAG: hypothetical protein IKN53_06650 [Oscillibacter sp.]|nr:hypothetical protein [Oscillibacter sp.]
MDERFEAWGGVIKETVANAAWLVGNGAKKLTNAARVQLKIADLRAEINAQMRTLGELIYATHVGNPTDSDVLLEHMEKIDALKAELASLTGAETKDAPAEDAAKDAEV